MSSSRRLRQASEDVDWGTDALTGLISPRAAEPAQPGASAREASQAGSPPRALPLPLPPPLAAATATVTPAVPSPPGTSRILWASYVILGLLAVSACVVMAQRSESLQPTPGTRTLSVASSASASAVSGRSAPTSKPEAREVRDPTPKAAAAAFARGDYREALGQYRGLAQQDPQQAAYQSLVRVLERRLVAKPAKE